ncbi:DUF927 domain-containing protein [Sporosarcina sp. Sa2YVA2]|uniref:DUF927 domain-containing protein n=1 Tax=Sporosarcina quadrami TaxID=2762234 RepID=A0ABR8UBA3_9BACL|nr:DUF927 domain-containing protein [Sporosarcina quadrami]MBD7985317.1 DUF927 domain-containing protein [Sporosarcina quadrami]
MAKPPLEIINLAERQKEKNQKPEIQTVLHPSGINVKIPEGFEVKDGRLYIIVSEGKGENKITFPVHLIRTFPIITRSLTNIERSEYYYEICWQNEGRMYKEVVPALTISTAVELKKISNMSLAVNDNNAKNLINFFDKFLLINNVPSSEMVERLGHVDGMLVHPLQNFGIEILPGDIGEKQIFEAFKTSGTSADWINSVFKLLEPHPKALLMVISSFTSIILEDLKLGPFIIDLSGPTSKGKTSVLKAAASVWGTEYLVSEWNGTAVSFERKSAFLNSFPLLLDDSMKADEKQLQRFIYNFSGGRSKGRGSISGSQKEFTWNNLMLSTGETSLLDYAERAGGAAARVLPIKGIPFQDVDHTFFSSLYSAMENNYGTIGLEFINKWKLHMNESLPMYYQYNEMFQRKSNGNEVVSRIARHYAALYFTAGLLMKFFNASLDIGWVEVLFDQIIEENKSVDKPMQMLEAILTDLDASRESISGKYEVIRDMKAIYKDGTLYVTPAYLKEFLGVEMSTIRNEWLRRGISIQCSDRGKVVDYKGIAHHGKTRRVVAINPDFIKELGFDFTELHKIT